MQLQEMSPSIGHETTNILFNISYHKRNNREREGPGAGRGREVVCSKVLIRMLESGVVCRVSQVRGLSSYRL